MSSLHLGTNWTNPILPSLMSNCSIEHSPLATATASLPSLLLNIALFQDPALNFPSLPSNFLLFSFSSRCIYSAGSQNYLLFSLPDSFTTSFCYLIRSIWSSLQHPKLPLQFLLPWSYINICLSFIISCLHSTSLWGIKLHKRPQSTTFPLPLPGPTLLSLQGVSLKSQCILGLNYSKVLTLQIYSKLRLKVCSLYFILVTSMNF